MGGLGAPSPSDLYMPPNFAHPLSPSLTSGIAVNRESQAPLSSGIVLFLGVAMIFIRFSMFHQIAAYLLHVNLYLLYIVGIPAVVAALLTGGVVRVLRYRSAVYWVWFMVWVLLAVPFSTWRGGSAQLAFTYLRTELIMLFIIGGLVVDHSKCRLILQTVAAACVCDLFIGRLFSQTDSNDRMSFVQFSTVSNENDFAGHLILILPFLLWITLTAKNILIRLLSLMGVAWGTYLMLASASRGAAVAIVVAAVYVVASAPGRLRLVFFLVAPLLVGGTLLLLPQRALQRLFSFSSSDSSASQEALASSEVRERLLRDSLTDMVEHPLFGVGPGQFSINEGKERLFGGGPGLWYQTHNSITQIGSECGIPALLLFLLAIGSTFQLLGRIGKSVQGLPQLADMASAVFCMRLSMVSFVSAIVFLNFGYFFYLPAMTGLAIILDQAVTRSLASVPFQPAVNAAPPYQFVPRLSPRVLPRFDSKTAGSKAAGSKI
jgi:hypothetical protein